MQEAANLLEYAQTSTFIDASRRVMGTTPGTYCGAQRTTDGRTVISVAFVRADSSTGTWIAVEGKADVIALHDEPFAIISAAHS